MSALFLGSFIHMNQLLAKHIICHGNVQSGGKAEDGVRTGEEMYEMYEM